MPPPPDEEWKNVPPTLFHYCNAEGLRGIIEDRCLWMSSVSSMNDYMEHNWLINLARNRLEPRLPRSINLLNPPDEFYEQLEQRLFSPPPATHYVVGFSSEGDVLSQWRAYADDGVGFAVGFDPRLFGIRPCVPSLNPTADNPDIGLFPVFYPGDSFSDTLDHFVTHCHDQATPMSPREAADKCYNEILQFALTTKTPAFKEEGEWRIVWLPTRKPTATNGIVRLCGPRFRDRNGRVIPYYELRCESTLNVMPIREIVLGPKNPHRQDVGAIRLLLTTHGHDVTHIRVRSSQATYR